jgi:hypothetical protein
MPMNEEKSDTSPQQSDLFPSLYPGALDIDSAVRGILVDAIRRSKKSREQIAEDMTYLVARSVTKTMLDCWTSETKEHQIPVRHLPAFCQSTGDNRALRLLADRAGMVLITPAEAQLIEVARRLEAKRRADADLEATTDRVFGGRQ